MPVKINKSNCVKIALKIYYIADDIGENQIRAAGYRSGEIEPDYFNSQPIHQDGINPGEDLTAINHRVQHENCKIGSVEISSPGFLNFSTGIVIKTRDVPE